MARSYEIRMSRRQAFGRKRRCHAVRQGTALCGLQPRAGWSGSRPDLVTCPDCRKKLLAEDP